MAAQRKLKNSTPANDLKKHARRRVLITLAPSPKTMRKAAVGFVLLLAVGLMALAMALMPGEPQKPAAALPQVVAQPVTPGNPLADIQVPASRLAPGAGANQPAIAIVAAKLQDLPVLSKKAGVRVTAEDEDEGDGDVQLIRAHALLDAGSFDAAQRLYQTILAADPRNHDALAGLMYIHARSGAWQQAGETGLRLLKFYPDDTQAKANLAHILAKTGKMDAAIHYLDLAAREAPGYLPFRLELAGFYDRAGHAAEALMLYRQVADAAAEDETGLPLPRIQERIAYLERSAGDAGSPSSTSPVDKR